jgi:hypothetical protein
MGEKDLSEKNHFLFGIFEIERTEVSDKNIGLL